MSTATVALLCIVSFTIAGGYSSRVSTAIGDEVIIKSANCGYRNRTLSPLQTPAANVYYGDRMTNAASYATQCYLNETNTGISECNQLTTSRIVGKIDTRAACPFNNTICREKSTNLRIDSGFLNSHIHFGVNAPPDQRIALRNVFHCAPLVTEGYTSLYFNQNPDKSLDGSTIYHYGGFSFAERKDYIFLAKTLQSQYSLTLSNDSVVGHSNFDLQVNPVIIENGTSSPYSFTPIKQISRHDADTFILFLSGNGVLFSQPSGDPWYRVAPTSTKFVAYGADYESPTQLYLPLEPASPLGCTAQYQFCNAGSGKCGPLASQLDAIAGAAPYFDTTYADFDADNAEIERAARFIYFIKSAVMPNAPYLQEMLGHLGSQALLSQRNLVNGWQYNLESNQWQQDMSHLWDIMMAGHQSALLDAAYGPTDPGVLMDWTHYTAPGLQKLCHKQKMRSTLYASFSLLGLVFIFLVGTLLSLASYILEPLSGILHKKGYHQYEHLEWSTNSTLQLQRSAYEALGRGTWANCTKTMPTTKEGESLSRRYLMERPKRSNAGPRRIKVETTATLPTGWAESATREEAQDAHIGVCIAQVHVRPGLAAAKMRALSRLRALSDQASFIGPTSTEAKGMRSLALVAPRLALALAALYALEIQPFVGATRISIFSDQSCRTPSGSISAKDSPGSGECTRLTSGLTSFMIGELGDGCAVTIYGNDPKDPICSATNLTLAETTVCYNSSWTYFSVDNCTPLDTTSSESASTSTASTTSTATTTATPNPPSNGVNVGAVVGGTISGVFVVAVLAGGAFYFFWFRPKQQRKLAELVTRSDTSITRINNPYVGNDAYTNPDAYAKNDPYSKTNPYTSLPNGPEEVYELSPQYIAEVHEQTHIRHELPP
ncbi:hypothetical protein F4803DRAFT_554594 [Xylaria telfairii]|nr:hypothetical protein F4803DRAFT_554594 [Xylaria telfairii]